MSYLVEDWRDVLRTGDMIRIRNYFTAANVNTRDEFGRTPLHITCAYDSPDNADVVAHLLDCRIDIEARNNGWTTLHYAAYFGKPNCLRVLLSRGVAIDSKDIMGHTPLVRALCYGQRECATLLLDWGAQLSAVHEWVNVPAWAPAYVAGRERTRVVAIILLGSRRKQRSSVLASNAMDVIRMIAKVVWSTRGDELWQETISPTH